MNKSFLALTLSLPVLFAANDSFGFARKKLQVSELKGVTESQVSKGEGKANVMVRGKAAELVFRMMKEKQEEQTDSDALHFLGSKDGAHFTVKGKQVTCSKISNTKKKQDDYACAFELDQSGSVAAASEAFNPAAFNLARTETGSKLFKKAKGRNVASAVTYSKGLAYLVYDGPGNQKNSETALIVFRGASAKELMGVLEGGPGNRETSWGDAKGRKGNEIACVSATAKEPERCALVVTFRDGSVTRSGNPLFR